MSKPRVPKPKGAETKGGELFYQLPDAKRFFSCWSNPLDCKRDFFPIRVRPKSFPKNGSGTSLIKGYPSLFEGGLYLGDLDSFWINEGRNASFFEVGPVFVFPRFHCGNRKPIGNKQIPAKVPSFPNFTPTSTRSW